MCKYIRNSKGSSTIIVVLFLAFLLGMTAFTVDAGMVYLEKSKLQKAVDAAALAGIAKFREGENSVINEANHLAALNGLNAANTTVTVANNNRKITVTASKNVPLQFAKIFNILSSTVTARASAVAAPITSVDGMRPLAVEQQNFEYGHTYTIKKGAGEAYSGNYGALAIGGSGASIYRNNLMYGYHADLSIGDWVQIGEDMTTEPGNMAGPTYDGISYLLEQDINTYHDISHLEPNCPRLIAIPIVDSLTTNGRTSVKVVGFASFFIDNVIYAGGKTEITGRFLETLGHGKIDENGTDYGFYGIKLVE